MDKQPCNSHDVEVRKGPWTMEEDLILINYIASHGGGVWNSIARAAGLKRTGKSCRLRWLNYLRPDVRRGNITPEEQLVIMELHSKWGNRWAKIAKHLPGRTDNEIKNYWRTRVQKHIKQGESCSTATSTAEQIISSHQQNDQAITTQIMSGAVMDQQHHHHHHHIGVETYSSPPSYPYPDQDQDFENFPPPNFPNESTDSIWSMEDLWSMQLLNAD